jgi:SH3 domain protein
MKRLLGCAFVLVAIAPSIVTAETIYVTDQFTVPLRSDPIATAPVVKTLTSGTALELIEQGAGFARVRDPQGTEGWIEAASLSQRPPSSVLAKSLRAELERTRAQVAQLQAQIDKGRTESGASSDSTQAQAEFVALQGQLARALEELKKKDEQLARGAAANATATDVKESQTGDDGFSFLWLGIALLALGLGFVSGVIWVRESIRRRMGGLYFKI